MLLTVLIVVAIAAGVLYIVNGFLPASAEFKKVFNIIVVVGVLLFILLVLLAHWGVISIKF